MLSGARCVIRPLWPPRIADRLVHNSEVLILGGSSSRRKRPEHLTTTTQALESRSGPLVAWAHRAHSTTRIGSEGGAHPGHAGGDHLGQGLSRDRHGGRCLSCPRGPLLCRDTGGERHPCVSMTPWPISRVLALVLFLALSIAAHDIAPLPIPGRQMLQGPTAVVLVLDASLASQCRAQAFHRLRAHPAPPGATPCTREAAELAARRAEPRPGYNGVSGWPSVAVSCASSDYKAALHRKKHLYVHHLPFQE